MTLREVDELTVAMARYESLAEKAYEGGREPSERERGIVLAAMQNFQGLATTHRRAIVASLTRDRDEQEDSAVLRQALEEARDMLATVALRCQLVEDGASVAVGIKQCLASTGEALKATQRK